MMSSDEAASSEPPIESNPDLIPSSSESTINLLYNDFNRLKSYPIIWRIILSKFTLALGGFYYSGNDYECTCVFCNVNLNASQYTENENLEEIHKNISPNCDFANGRPTQNEAIINFASDYRFEQNRLISFLKINWTAPVDPYDLAKWGFYYLGTDDVARCTFCRLEVRGWEQGDRGETEHERWNAGCPFLRGREVGNVPLGQGQPRSVNSDSVNIAIDANQINYVGQGPRASACQLGFVTLRDARHPQYSTSSARLATYDLWPMSISQRPEELVGAGFYYTGRGDRVICYYCGGGLKDWGVGDQVWVEHAVWFPDCQYLQLKKGPAFVQQVRALRDAQSASELQQFNQSTVNAVQPPSPPQAVPAPPTQAVQQPNQQPISPVETANQQPSEASGLSAEPKPLEEASTAGPTVVSEMVDDGMRACKVCFQKELGIVFLPCGHMATCPDCAPQLRNCPICRAVASAYIRAYLP